MTFLLVKWKVFLERKKPSRELSTPKCHCTHYEILLSSGRLKIQTNNLSETQVCMSQPIYSTSEKCRKNLRDLFLFASSFDDQISQWPVHAVSTIDEKSFRFFQEMIQEEREKTKPRRQVPLRKRKTYTSRGIAKSSTAANIKRIGGLISWLKLMGLSAATISVVLVSIQIAY